MILPGIEDISKCIDPANFEESMRDQKFGKMEGVFL
jgi:hypothetical protein